jgi:hypothetical protein
MNTRTNKTILLITLMICLATAVYSAVGTFTFRTSGASDTTEVVDLRYPQKVPEDSSVTTDSIADGSITNDKLAEPVSVTNGGHGKTTAAEGLAALGGASLNGSSTVDFSARAISVASEILIATSTDAGDYKLQVAGNAIMSGTVIRFSTPTSVSIITNSSDGADNREVHFASGGTTSSTRGSGVDMYGNEHAVYPGDLYLFAGNNSVGSIKFAIAGIDRMRVTPAGEVLIATSTDAGAYNLQVNGNAYFHNDVSALSFTDRTPAPAGLAESYAIVESHRVQSGELDHAALHPAAWGKKNVYKSTGRMVRHKNDKGEEAEEPELEGFIEPDQTKRNLSITVTAQALVIQDLIKRVKKLEGN